MRKNILCILTPVVISLIISGCGSAITDVRLYEEFSLAPGQTVTIGTEDLEIRFLEVAEDSRCPIDVTCIWEGRATAIVEIAIGGGPQRLELSEPGLTDAPANIVFQNYRFIYEVEPYPRVDRQIAPGEYRLVMLVTMSGDN